MPNGIEDNVLYLLLGIAIGVLLTAKSIREVTAKLPDEVYAYTIFGFLLYGATAALKWPGFTCVILAFVFYHLVGSEGWPTALRSFFSFKWLPWPKKKEPSPPTDEGASDIAGTET